MLTYVLALLGGLILLTGGAFALVRGAAALALRLGLPPLLVGLTVVAFGTSAPELVVSVDAAVRGAGGIAVGNVVGSNIANVGLILALAALLRPIVADRTLLRRDAPLMLIVTIVVVGLLLDGRLGAVEGGMLVLGLAVYLGWSIRHALRGRQPAGAVEAGLPGPSAHPLVDGALAVGGLLLLVVGADLLVNAAVVLAEAFGVGNAVIGLTVVAVGTSLPELATSLVAAARGESDIAVGNVIGSNLFNLLGILGVAAMVRPLHAPGLGAVDLAAVLGIALLGAVLLATGGRLTRMEGAGLLAVYGAYVAYLAVNAGAVG